MSDRAGGLLFTGASGFVGQSVLVRWLARTDRPVTVLVRAADDVAARARGRAARRARRGRGAARARARAGRDVTARPRAWPRRVPARRPRSTRSSTPPPACASTRRSTRRARSTSPGPQRMLALARRLHADAPAAPLRAGVDRVSSPACTPAVRRGRPPHRPGVSQQLRAVQDRGRGAGRRRGADGLPVQIVRPSSSSATASRAGPRRSTCSTCRCGRWSPAPSTPCPSRIAGCSTSCRSTTSPTGCSRCQTRPPTAAPTT